MPFEVKLGIFWLIAFAALWFIKRRPHSLAASVLLSWHGPFPLVHEPRSSYYRRKCLFAIGWLVQLLAAASLVVLLAWLVPGIRESEPFVLVAGFALCIGIGMAVLGALLAGLVSLKAYYLGPNPALISSRELHPFADGQRPEA